jgi:Skp family chaperone for outer membrane proteins
MSRLAQAAALALAFLAGAPAAAQTEPPPAVPFLTVDQERLFADSLWGRRAVKEIEEASKALQAENRKIEAALTAEEKALTERRPTLPPEEFRKLADEFDSRVSGIRKAQDDKARSIAEQRDRERQAFFEAALPIMGEVMSERGAVAILDNRAIFLSVKAIDATEAVLARLNDKLGAGPAQPQPD